MNVSWYSFTAAIGIFLGLFIGEVHPLSASGKAITVKHLEAYPTFECIGLRLYYAGDADSNAAADVRYRVKGKKLWHQALPLARIKDCRFAGSIFFLTPGTEYEIEVLVSDPDGVSGAKASTMVKTRSADFPLGRGKEYYVSPGGDDSNKGTALKPFRTIQKAADIARAGDVVRVRPGVYREQVSINRSGKQNACIAFIAQGKGVILSGADPRFENPQVSQNWQAETGGVYSTDPGFSTRYLAVHGIRLYHYRSRKEFEEFICGEPGGWYQDENTGRLFLRLSSSENPNRIPVQIAALDAGFHVQDADHVLIDGFEIRDYGSQTGGQGVHLERASWCVVRNCSIHGMQAQVRMTGSETEGNLIEDCEIWDTSISRWPWRMTKSHDEEGAGVHSTGGRGNVVRNCRIHGLFDGLAPSYWDSLWAEAYNCDWDVYDNEIFDIRDDIIEPEGPCINFRFWNNVCHDLFVGVSLAPINVGPIYVLYNSIYDLKFKNIKYGRSAPGWCYILHNTFWSKNPGHDLIEINRPLEAQIFHNNIFFSNAVAIRSSRMPLDNNDLDYNDWYSSDIQWFESYTGTKHKRLFYFERKGYSSLEEFQKAFGWEKHGVQADPMFVDPEAGDLRLKADSPCIDRGQALPNINDSYHGSAPDMGAFEWGSSIRGPFPLGRRPGQ